MKKLSFLLAIAGLCLFASCKDDSLDPFRLADIKKGSIIALRGQAVDNLSEAAFRGAIDSFSRSGNIANETLDFEADFLSEDLTSIAKVITYARASDSSPRVKIGEQAGSTFAVPAGGNYPRAAFSIPTAGIFSAIGKARGDYAAGDYIYIENDIELTDGSTVAASSIVNSSLFESALFYPAHSFRFLAGQ